MVDWTKEFFLLTDASGTAMGGCLMQKDDKGFFRPLRYMSRGFDKYEQAQENRERELPAGWYCMLKCHSMLSHTVFTWFCDHANAKWIMTAKLQVARIARLALWLSEYYYNLQHLLALMCCYRLSTQLAGWTSRTIRMTKIFSAHLKCRQCDRLSIACIQVW